MVEMTRERLAKESVMFIPLRFGTSVMLRPPDALHFPTCGKLFKKWLFPGFCGLALVLYTYQEIKLKLLDN